MIAEKWNEKLVASILKDETQIAVAAALEKFVSQLADAKAAVHMGLAKTIDQIAERQ